MANLSKRKPSLLVRIVLVVIVTIASLLMIISSLDSKGNIAENPNAPSSETINAADQNSDAVILDDDYIKITFRKISETVGIEGCYLTLHVENKTDSEIWVHLDKASVNDEMVPLVMSGVPMYIQPSKSSNNPFILPYEALSIKSIDEIDSISFKVIVDNNETNENIETTEMLTISF